MPELEGYFHDMSHNEENNDEMKSTHPSHTHEYIWIGDAINLSLIQAERDQNPVCGIPSGFPTLDRLTRGWGKGDLVVIGGRPSTGKTALALSMARHAAVDFSIPTVYFSFGTPCLDISDRLIVSETGISMETLHGGAKMNQTDWQRLESSLRKLSSSPLYLDGTSAGIPGEFLLGEFKCKADRLASEMSVKLFLVDGFEETISDRVQWEPENFAHEIRENLQQLKDFAKYYGAAIVVLSREGRPTQQKYPGPIKKELDCNCSDVYDYADKIIRLHRPSICGSGQDGDMSIMELRLVQNKGGRTGTVCLSFNQERIRVVNPEEGRSAAGRLPISDTSEPGTF